MNPYDIAQIFVQMECDIIASMRRNLTRHKLEEAKEGFEWEQWQKRKLEGLQRYSIRNKKILEDYSKIIDAVTVALIKKSFIQGGRNEERYVDRFWDKLKAFFIAKKITRPIATVDDTDESFFRVNEKRVNALINAVRGDLKAAQYAMLRQADDVYRQTIFQSQMYLNAGAASLYQAVDMATKDFLEKGINCIQYKDGRRVNIASYAELVLRASSQRAVFMGGGAKRDEWGIHTVVISSHNNSSALCLPWQGKVYIDDVYSGGKKGEGKYPLLSTAINAGLFHPHCRHNMSTYFEGISSLPEPVDDTEALKNYTAEQQQRGMERQIRKWKRREVGSIMPENQINASNKVREWQGKLREHLKANPQLRRDPWREQIQAGISPKQRNENLKKLAENAKIEEIRNDIKSGKQPLTIEEGKQGKHILGHNNYIDGRSYLIISQDEAQELINKYAGTGEFLRNSKGILTNKELIKSDRAIGKVIDLDGNEVETSKAIIHYSKKGTHIVPTLREMEVK